jgi:hypothetical protein
MRFRAAIGALILLLSTSAAFAQDTVQKSEVTLYVQSAGGQPHVCGIEYTILYLDRTYREGALAAIRGTLGWVAHHSGNVGIIFKVLGMDFPHADKHDMAPQVFPIPHAFLMADGKPHNVHDRLPCEPSQSTGFCGAYFLPASIEIYMAAFSGKLSIGFNREPQSLDVSLPLDARESNPNEYPPFRACMTTILDRAKAQQ